MAAKNSGKKSGSTAGCCFLFLFGLPFFLVGCATLYLAAEMAVNSARARNWVEVQATIESVELKHNDDSAQVRCTYTYTFEGREFTGDRVSFKRGSDNIDTWQKDTYDRLRRHKERKESVACYMNPDRPEEAVLDRDLRVGAFCLLLIFPIVFGGVGAAMMFGALYARRQMKLKKALEAAHPDEPWLWKPGAESKRISSKAGWLTVGAWGIAILWNAISSPLLFFLPEEVQKGNTIALIGLIFPLAGSALLIIAIRATLQQRKFGRSYFSLETLPGVVGGHLRGDLVIVGPLVAMEGMDVSLNCIRSTTKRRGGERRTERDTIWRVFKRLEARSTRFGEEETHLPIDFQIPYECRSCDDSDSDDSVSWELEVRASVPGVDLNLDFDVPVYKTAESDPSVGQSAEAIAAEREVVESQEPPQPGKIREETDEKGHPCLVCSCWPGFGAGVALLVGTVVCASVTVHAVIEMTRGDLSWTPFLLGFGLGFVVTALIFASFLGSFRISVNREGITIMRNYVLFRSTRTMARDQITRIEYKHSAKSGNTKYYAVHVVSSAGVKTKMAGMLKGETSAKWLKRWAERELGIGPETIG